MRVFGIALRDATRPPHLDDRLLTVNSGRLRGRSVRTGMLADQQAETRRLEGLGGRVIAVGVDIDLVIMEDPEGSRVSVFGPRD